MHRLLLLFSFLATASAQPVDLAIDLGPLSETGAFQRDGLADLRPGDVSVGVRGSAAPLAWDRSLALTDPDGDGVYTARLTFPEGTGTVEYKAVVEGEEVIWEAGGNRLLFPGRMETDRRAFGGFQTGLPVLTVSQAQLSEDLGLLRSAMEALHPGLTLHNTPAELEAISQRLTRRARGLAEAYGEAIPMPEVYLAVTEAVAALRDGHTQVSMYNQSEYLSAVLYERPDRAPFTFRLVEGRMIVTGDATERGPAGGGVLPPGTEILSMDGRPVAEIIEAMMPYVSADGSNDAKRVYELQTGALTAPAERFDVLYSLLYEPSGDLALRIRQPDGTERGLAVGRVTQTERRETLWARDARLPRSQDDLLSFRFLADGTAYLRIGSFSTFNMDLDYDAWLTDAFRQINDAHADRLVVDLRGCAGGMDDAAALLFRHLLRQPVTVDLWDGQTAYDVVPGAIRPHIRSWNNGFYDLSAQVTPAGDGTFRLPPRDPITVPPAADAFGGAVAVLVDAAASSATFYLADQIQHTGAATLVGQTTGGSLKGLNAGQMVFLNLPHSGIAVDIPLFGSRPSEPGPDRGVIPDVLVPPNADAVIAGRDPELDAALAFLARTSSVSSGDLPAGLAEDAGGPIPFAALAGEWAGTLTYTDYSDDTSRTTLTFRASASPRREGSDREGVRLNITFVEPDGSPGGQGRRDLANLQGRTDRVGYGGDQWAVLRRTARPDGFTLVIEGREQDNNRPATVRHTLTLRDGVFTDRKEVRYDGTDAFFERNLFRFTRP